MTIKRGIARVYFLPHQDGRFVRSYDGELITQTFIDFDLDEDMPVRIHIPDFCMQIDIKSSGVHISYHSEALLARE